MLQRPPKWLDGVGLKMNPGLGLFSCFSGWGFGVLLSLQVGRAKTYRATWAVLLVGVGGKNMCVGALLCKIKTKHPIRRELKTWFV